MAKQNLSLETDLVEVQAIAKEATIWAYPMVANYYTIYNYTIDEEGTEYKGPMNQIHNVRRVYTPEDMAIITPNSDTPYSHLIMDLRAEPLVVTIPSIDSERYYSTQLIDLYTFNFDYLGTRVEGNGGGNYLIAGPNWSGEQPEGIERVIPSETYLAYGLFRTQLFNPDDLDDVVEIQDQYNVQPLSQFLGTQPPTTPPELDYPPIIHQILEENFLELEENLFEYVNFLLQFCPTHGSEVELRERFRTIGIEPGAVFPPEGVSPEWLNAIRAGQQEGMDEIDQEAEQTTSSLELFGTREDLNNNYLKRAVGARVGIYGNSAAEAFYPGYRFDQNGYLLDSGEHNYQLKIPAEGLPADAFWSVTMYDGNTRLLIDNEIDRYLINSPMLEQLQMDGDGGITLYLQHESPGNEKQSNWLPAPDGLMYVVMRLYIPQDSVLNGTWTAPSITMTIRVKEAYEYTSPSLQSHKAILDAIHNDGLQTNGFCHKRELIDHTFTAVVSPNNDTIYSAVLVDLRQSPQIFTVPDTGDRYISVMMTDLRAYNFNVLVKQPGSYLFAVKGYNASVPHGMTLYETESDILFFVVRTAVNGENDLDHVHSIQDRMTIEPLLSVDNNHEPLYPPPIEEHWVTRMQWILERSPALDRVDYEIAEFITNLTPSMDNQNIGEETHAELEEYGNTITNTIGIYGKRENITVDHRTRAASNLYAHLALENERATYPKISQDADGHPLVGSQRYTFTMPAESPVTEDGFWSLTVYVSETKQFVPNDEHLYRISDSTATFNHDRTVTITLGGVQDGTPNWLPLTNNDQEWYALLRLYEGKPDVVDGSWPIPPINKCP